MNRAALTMCIAAATGNYQRLNDGRHAAIVLKNGYHLPVFAHEEGAYEQGTPR